MYPPDEIFLSSCAVRFMFFTPSISEVISAYRWKNSVNGSFDELYPGGMSQELIDALLAFDAGFQAGRIESYEDAKRKAKE